MGVQEVAIIAGFIFFVLVMVIISLNEKYNEVKNERDCLLSNIDNLKEQKDFYYNEVGRIKWNNEIQEKTEYKEEYKPNKKIKALVGDYMQSTLLNTNSVLKSLGIETEVVPSGEDVVERIKNSHKREFDVIITNNIYRGHLDGLRTMDKLRELPGFKIPVVVLTVSQNERDYFIRECGFDEYMTKVLTQEKAIKGLTSAIKGLKFEKIK